MYTESVIDRVSRHMAAAQDTEGCWEWPMSRTRAGYGQLAYSVNGHKSLAYAHRAAYFIANGPIKDGDHICHSCDNPGCFNPAHLFSGTAKDNMSDMAAKGRSNAGKRHPLGDRHWSKSRRSEIRGSANGHSKLTEADVLAIRASGEKGVTLAARYGVSQTTISHLRKGNGWPHLSQPVG